ncbi:hypothetical protein CL617_05040 [archaeon]|nr:hypothetical protein [archaeon]
MVWWLFRTKREKHEEKLEKLTNDLKISFNLIKKDIKDINNKVNKLENSDSFILGKLDSFDKQINLIGPNINELKQFKETKKESTVNNEYTNELLSSLTSTQIDLFKTIYSLSQQLQTEDISIKSLSKVIYPQKKYKTVRSTLSEYLTVLSTLGLISKKRKGKQTFVSLTSFGKGLIQNLKLKQEKKRKKENAR